MYNYGIIVLMVLYVQKFQCDSLAANATSECLVTIIGRNKWNMVEVKSPTLLRKAPPYVIISHTASKQKCTTFSECSDIVKYIQHMHRIGRGWDDIGYNFLIGGDGRVYEGRGWNVQGAHTYGYNSVSCGIAFIGTFTEKPPSNIMVKAAQNLIKCGVKKGYISPAYGVYGHSDARCIESPGRAFYQTLKSWPHWHARGPIKQICPEYSNKASSTTETTPTSDLKLKQNNRTGLVSNSTS